MMNDEGIVCFANALKPNHIISHELCRILGVLDAYPPFTLSTPFESGKDFKNPSPTSRTTRQL
ncbi:MAG: hypothetical protein PHC50_04025 [Candidatus Cloacimonetes bacterium]|nr:hypothetical protein [Candidatus Cloacimonadota bacterium]